MPTAKIWKNTIRSEWKLVINSTAHRCEYGVNIHFGKGCFVNYNCTFLDCAPITLEDGVWVGANVTIATPCHPFLSDERLPQQYPDGFHDLEYAKPIHIGSGSWICSSATICGGVTIGKNCIVAAGPDTCVGYLHEKRSAVVGAGKREK